MGYLPAQSWDVPSSFLDTHQRLTIKEKHLDLARIIDHLRSGVQQGETFGEEGVFYPADQLEFSALLRNVLRQGLQHSLGEVAKKIRGVCLLFAAIRYIDTHRVPASQDVFEERRLYLNIVLQQELAWIFARLDSETSTNLLALAPELQVPEHPWRTWFSGGWYVARVAKYYASLDYRSFLPTIAEDAEGIDLFVFSDSGEGIALQVKGQVGYAPGVNIHSVACLPEGCRPELCTIARSLTRVVGKVNGRLALNCKPLIALVGRDT